MAKGVGKARSRRGARPGTRSLIALVLVGFVLMATGVIARRVLGVAAESTIGRLRQRKSGLEAERIQLERVIREASSRARLQPIAEQRLNMHIPSPDQQVLLARPTSPVSPPPQRTPPQ
jgi:cell division protein FtsL